MTRSRPLAEYPGWLFTQVVPNRQRDFYELFTILHAKEFLYTIASDRNRLQDARDVRREGMYEFGFKAYVDTEVLGPISVLEVLIGISRRCAFQTSTHPGEWAWVLIQNLELNKYSGRISRRWAAEIDDILERLIWRKYQPDGVGGFFPLAWPAEDQRNVEISYQLSAYLREAAETHNAVQG